MDPLAQRGIGKVQRVRDGLEAVPVTTSRTAWARRNTRASLVCLKKVSKVDRALSGKWSLRVRMMVVSRIKYYKNISTPRGSPIVGAQPFHLKFSRFCL